jgi:hypothetical protein
MAPRGKDQAMRVCLALMLIALVPAALRGGDVPVFAAQAAVRSGPSDTYYVAGELNAGDRVQVLRVVNDYAEIKPPRGSFSLVPCDAVQMLGAGRGYVQTWMPTAALVGRAEPGVANVIAAHLTHGHQLEILGRELVQTSAGPKEHYRIAPTPREVRYLALSALEPNKVTELTGRPAAAAPLAPAASSGNDAGAGPPADVASHLAAADAAYQRGRRTGDFAEARKHYRELAQSLNHEARMTALNRLEFIKQLEGRPPEREADARLSGSPAAYGPPGPWAPEGSRPQVRRPAAAPVQPPANPAPAVPPRQPADVAVPARTTATANPTPAPAAAPQDPTPPAPPAAAPQGAGQGPLVGVLKQSSWTAYGQPLYYLVDHQGNLKTYVSPPRGVSLRSLVDRNVQVHGAQRPNDPAVGGKPLVTATRVEPLALPSTQAAK